MKLKLTILGLFLAFSWQTVTAQEETASNWDLGGDAGLTFFQSSFSNWTDGGGEATTTIGALGNLFAKYKNGRTSWDNLGLLQYQIQKVGQDADFLKAVDRLELLSVAGYNVSANNNSAWSYSFLASLKTQMTETEADSVLQSSFFAPAEILLAPGMKYSIGDKKTKYNLLVNFSPATAKFIIVGDQALADLGTFTGEPATFDALGNKLTDGTTLRTEFGASLVGNYRLNVIETDNIKLTWQTNLELFSNYLEDPQNIDVKWTNLITTNLFKYFTVSLATDLRYDDNVAVPVDRDGDGINEGTGARTRFAQTFGVGIGYKF
jgi:opacity protein-like surface antigen